MITKALLCSRRLAMCAMTAAVLAGCAAAPPGPSPDLLQRIETARTRADHESIAAHFAKEATEARALAAIHRQMARTYQGASGRMATSMPGHCNAIVRAQEALAAEYEAMAAVHRESAKQAPS